MRLRKNNVFVFVCHKDVVCWTRLCPSKMNVSLLNPPFFIDFSSHPFADTVGAESPFPILFSRFHFLLFLLSVQRIIRPAGGFSLSPFPLPLRQMSRVNTKKRRGKGLIPFANGPFPPLHGLFPPFPRWSNICCYFFSSSVSGSLWATREAGGDGVKELCLLYAFFPCVCLSVIQLRYWVQRKLCFDLHMWKDTTSDVGLCFFSIRDGQRALHFPSTIDLTPPYTENGRGPLGGPRRYVGGEHLRKHPTLSSIGRVMKCRKLRYRAALLLAQVTPAPIIYT